MGMIWTFIFCALFPAHEVCDVRDFTEKIWLVATVKQQPILARFTFNQAFQKLSTGTEWFQKFLGNFPENLKTVEFPKCVHAQPKWNETEISENKISNFLSIHVPRRVVFFLGNSGNFLQPITVNQKIVWYPTLEIF